MRKLYIISLTCMRLLKHSCGDFLLFFSFKETSLKDLSTAAHIVLSYDRNQVVTHFQIRC